MTIRPRVVRALRDVRERLRDAAAATHAKAATAAASSHAELSAEHDRLEEFLVSARDVLAVARTVHEVDRVAETVVVHRLAIADASARHDAAVTVTQATASALRDRTRQLKSAEKLHELVTEHHATTAAKAEQRGNDDLAAAPRLRVGGRR
ncbi:MAG: hypothetical protein WKG01_38375 [Kofleriaceae bacterium]